MSLYDALGHQWLEGVATLRQSVLAPMILETLPTPEVVQACRMFNKEAQALHQCIVLLQRENRRLRDAQERREESRAAREKEGRRTSTPRRAETPSMSSRTTGVRTPGTSSALRVTSPARTGMRPGRSSVTEVSNSSMPRPGTSRLTTRSPLARSAASTVRRGTPVRVTTTSRVRTSGTTPLRSGTPSRTTTTGRSTSAVRGGTARLTNSMLPVSQTPGRTSTPGRLGTRSTTPGRSAVVSQVSSSKDLHIGDIVTYKGYRAAVRFNGPTAFGAGIWIGLEMFEGNEGTNDGSSFIDKKQYFTCPKGKGVFVRASQVKKV
uniref:Uncharacterized protein TCIL3000_10_12640 n=1 Tax=Trypanosoma congolense (strain IL3000) TaxID=1068625 RepID=G0UYL5_TRYCI|nr:unnamed protein product [Trypanosoma congolense IL3000]